MILATVAQCWGLMREPEVDYYRFTDKGLRYLAESAGFEVVKVDPRGGKWLLIGARLSSAIYYSCNRKITTLGRPFMRSAARSTVRFICGIVQSFFAFLDRKDFDPGDTLGWCLLARKPS